MSLEKQLKKTSEQRMSQVDIINFEKNFKTVAIKDLLNGVNSIEDVKDSKFIPYPLVNKFLQVPLDNKIFSKIYEFRNKSYVNDSICLLVYKITLKKYDEKEILTTYNFKKQDPIDSLVVSKYDYYNDIEIKSTFHEKNLMLRIVKLKSKNIESKEDIKYINKNTFKFE